MLDIPRNKLNEVIGNYDVLFDRVKDIIKVYKFMDIEFSELEWLQIGTDEIFVDYRYYDSGEYFQTSVKFPIDWLYLDNTKLKMKAEEKREADRCEMLRKEEERKKRAVQEAEAREKAELARLKAKYES